MPPPTGGIEESIFSAAVTLRVTLTFSHHHTKENKFVFIVFIYYVRIIFPVMRSIHWPHSIAGRNVYCRLHDHSNHLYNYYIRM